MYCNHCGTQLPEGSQFCSICGQGVAAQGPPPTGPVPRPWPITTLAIVDILGAVVCLPLGLLFLADAGKDPFGAGLGLFFTVLGTLSLAAGLGMLRLKPFGRIIQLVFACIGLIGFPLGTVVSILVLIYLLKPGAKILFSGRPREQMTPAELASVAQLSLGGGWSIAVVAVVSVLIGIFVIGIIAAIAIPNLLNAIERGRQKRTIADIRSIAVAMEAYAKEHGSYPAADSPRELASQLQPTYIRQLPGTDAWQHEFRVRTWQANRDSEGPDSYGIVSAGKGGIFESEEPSDYQTGPTADFSADIVLVNGSFVRYPEGVKP